MKKNGFRRAGEVGVGIIRFFTVAPVEFGLRHGSGKDIRFRVKKGKVKVRSR